jgi:hypothetical protein
MQMVKTVETEPGGGRGDSEALDVDARERGPEARLRQVRAQGSSRHPGALLCYAFSAPPTS